MNEDVPAWLRKAVEREVTKDRLPDSERFAQLLTIPMTVVFLWFFFIHQSRPTGFFTDDFGALEAALFYGVIVLGLVPAFVRLLTGRKNSGRPFDIMQMAFFAVAGAYLLSEFPFDFHHFADALPSYLQPTIDWMTDGIAKFVMAIALIAVVVSIPWNLLMYVFVGQRLPSEGMCCRGSPPT